MNPGVGYHFTGLSTQKGEVDCKTVFLFLLSLFSFFFNGIAICIIFQKGESQPTERSPDWGEVIVSGRIRTRDLYLLTPRPNSNCVEEERLPMQEC